jgi:DNA-binding transcriptional LysR family regulator
MRSTISSGEIVLMMPSFSGIRLSWLTSRASRFAVTAGEEPDERTHIMPLFREQMVIAVNRDHRLARERNFPVEELNGESYIHRMNCDLATHR